MTVWAVLLSIVSAVPAFGQAGFETTIVPQVEHTNALTAISYSDDGRLLLTGGYDGTVRLWDVETGLLLRGVVAHQQAIYARVLSRDGRSVLTASHDLSAKVWETRTGRLVRSFAHPAPYGLPQAAALSPGNSRAFTGTLDGVIREFDVASGAQVRSCSGGPCLEKRSDRQCSTSSERNLRTILSPNLVCYAIGGDMTITGGCHCGAIRYEATGEAMTHALCHCSDCRRCAGAPLVGWTMYKLDAVNVTRGTPKVYKSSKHGRRHFCSDCGTGIFYMNAEILPGIIDIQSATYDDPTAVPPRAHIQVAERINWMEHAHELPTFERYPPSQ